MTDLGEKLSKAWDALDALVMACDHIKAQEELTGEQATQGCPACQGIGCSHCKNTGELPISDPHGWAADEVKKMAEHYAAILIAHRDHTCRFEVRDDDRGPSRCVVCGRNGDA